MKKKTAVILNGSKPNNTREKIMAIIVLLIIFAIMLAYTIVSIVTNIKFAKEINNFSKLNSETTFSIDKIYMYSGANAESNSTDKAVWDLNIHQYTNIAIYINNRSEQELNYANSIKEMYIENVRFTGLKSGEPTLQFMDINNFGKYVDEEENTITDKLEYKVLNDGDINYSEAEIYADCSNPIVLQYIDKNIKKNEIISDTSSELKFDGELLRKTNIPLDSIKCNLAFDIIIINNYDQKFIANVYIDIPLEDTETGNSIYEGKFIKKLENTNLIRFFRVK